MDITTLLKSKEARQSLFKSLKEAFIDASLSDNERLDALSILIKNDESLFMQEYVSQYNSSYVDKKLDTGKLSKVHDTLVYFIEQYPDNILVKNCRYNIEKEFCKKYHFNMKDIMQAHGIYALPRLKINTLVALQYSPTYCDIFAPHYEFQYALAQLLDAPEHIEPVIALWEQHACLREKSISKLFDTPATKGNDAWELQKELEKIRNTNSMFLIQHFTDNPDQHLGFEKRFPPFFVFMDKFNGEELRNIQLKFEQEHINIIAHNCTNSMYQNYIPKLFGFDGNSSTNVNYILTMLSKDINYQVLFSDANKNMFIGNNAEELIDKYKGYFPYHHKEDEINPYMQCKVAARYQDLQHTLEMSTSSKKRHKI